MTIYEVLKQNIRILEGLRIPAGERAIWDAIQGVLQNENACISAMEQDRAKQEQEAPAAEKEGEQDAEAGGEEA